MLSKPKKIKSVTYNWFEGINTVVTILTFLTTIFLFLKVEQQQLKINLESSQEQIARERVKLVFSILDLEDPRKAIIGLKAIKETYPDTNDDWINKIEQILNEDVIVNIENEYTSLLRIQTALENELEKAINKNDNISIGLLNRRLEVIRKKLSSLKNELSN